MDLPVRQAALTAVFLLIILQTSSCSSDELGRQTRIHTYKTTKRMEDGKTKNLTCMMCYPGTFVNETCKEDFGFSVCEDCPDGTFLAFFNKANRCKKCSQCREENQVIKRNCTKTQDIECQCKECYEWTWIQKEPLHIGYCKFVYQLERNTSSAAVDINNGNVHTEAPYTVHTKTASNGKSAKASVGNQFQPLSFLCSIILSIVSVLLARLQM